MKGDFVVLRAFGGPAVGRLVEMVEDIVFVASESEFSNLVNGLPAIDPVGFPVRDVFQYTPELQKEIARGEVNWTRFKPYKEKAEAEKA